MGILDPDIVLALQNMSFRSDWRHERRHPPTAGNQPPAEDLNLEIDGRLREMRRQTNVGASTA
jgi:hypothetical protein